MSKTIQFAAAVLATICTTAHAGNGYCDTRSSQSEMYRCYVSANNTKDQQRSNLVHQIYNMQSLPDSEKRRISNVERSFENDVNTQCRGNVICIYNSLNAHNIELYQYIQENK